MFEIAQRPDSGRGCRGSGLDVDLLYVPAVIHGMPHLPQSTGRATNAHRPGVRSPGIPAGCTAIGHEAARFVIDLTSN